RMMEETSDRIVQSLKTYTAIPHTINQINADALRLGQLDLQDFRAIERHLWYQIQNFNSVTYIQLASEGGQFVGVERLNDKDISIILSDPLKGNSQERYATDRQGNRTQLLVQKPNYDPRRQPWYRASIRAGKATWSEVYTYFDFSKLAITGGLPLYDDRDRAVGVAAVDLSLSHISQFLQTLEFGYTGQTFIIERDGLLVATSTSERPFNYRQQQPQRLAAKHSLNPLTRATTRYLLQKYPDLERIQTSLQLHFDLDGKNQCVRVTPFSDRFGLDWLIVTVVSEAEFMAGIEASNRTTLLLFLGAVAIAVVLGFLTARSISQPLLRLSAASQKIASGLLGERVEEEGSRELHILARSFNQMAEQLRGSFSALAAANDELETRVEQRTAELQESQAQLQQQARVLEERVKQRTAELLKAKEAAETANEAKNTFLATMSHELRTPLNAILGFAQLMEYDSALSTMHRDNIDTIRRSGEHLLELINDVLDMSKIESGRMVLSEYPFDFHRLLERVEQIFQPQAKEKGLELIVECSPDISQYLCTDERKLRRILTNLLSNAMKFTDSGSITLRVSSANSDRLSIGTFHETPVHQSSENQRGGDNPEQMANDQGRMTKDKGQIYFEIEDTGCGIPEEDRDELFEAFVQSKAQQGFQEGTGLGLPISRAFARLMGGDLVLQRTTVGGGATFAFEIRATLAEATQVEPIAPLRRVVGLESGQPTYRLLVVDNNLENRQLLLQLLQPLGFAVREAIHGLEALEVWKAWQPHLILMDLRMPVMDGYEATQRIRSHLQGEATAIIALTARVFREEKAAIVAAGFDDVASKPFRNAELLAVIAKHLGVRYVYEALEACNCEALDSALTSDAIAVLPKEWLASLEQAILYGDLEGIESAIAQIRTQDSAIALALQHYLNEFDYPKILSLISENFIS
ncbi:MAG: ATP-binding protein, partial [Cyanobacteriota bacterium]|nr:ATP-binding protein [Cyanobacteriota bacterium]